MKNEIEEIIDNVSNCIKDESNKKELKEFRFIAKHIQDIIFIQDLNFNILYVSPSVKMITGYKPEEIIEKDAEKLLTENSFKKAKNNFIQYFKKAQANKDIEIPPQEYEYYRKDGSVFWGEFTSKFIYNSEGIPIATIGVLRNITERKEQEKKIRYLSFHDQLTDLYNRRYFENEMERLNGARKLPISIIMGDMDDLKKINDNYGHNVGDKCIRKMARIIEKVTREEDIVARISGDEFAIILPETDSFSAQKVLKRINKKCEQVNKLEKLETSISITFGYEVTTDKEQDLEKVFEEADKEMYKNKNSRFDDLDKRV